MKLDFLTITVANRCFDLPKDMPIPQKGDNVFGEEFSGTITYANYHINKEGRLHTISLFADKT